MKTTDDWNRGTYIRWAVTTAWSVLEICCIDALSLGGVRIGDRFKEKMKTELSNKGLSAIDWGSGVWQEVLELKKLRDEFTHISIPQEKLWPEIEIANGAIETIRNAVKEIYRISDKDIPEWIDDDGEAI